MSFSVESRCLWVHFTPELVFVKEQISSPCLIWSAALWLGCVEPLVLISVFFGSHPVEADLLF